MRDDLEPDKRDFGKPDFGKVEQDRDELAARGLLSRGEGGREVHLERRLADALAARVVSL